MHVFARGNPIQISFTTYFATIFDFNTSRLWLANNSYTPKTSFQGLYDEFLVRIANKLAIFLKILNIEQQFQYGQTLKLPKMAILLTFEFMLNSCGNGLCGKNRPIFAQCGGGGVLLKSTVFNPLNFVPILMTQVNVVDCRHSFGVVALYQKCEISGSFCPKVIHHPPPKR